MFYRLFSVKKNPIIPLMCSLQEISGDPELDKTRNQINNYMTFLRVIYFIEFNIFLTVAIGFRRDFMVNFPCIGCWRIGVSRTIQVYVRHVFCSAGYLWVARWIFAMLTNDILNNFRIHKGETLFARQCAC